MKHQEEKITGISLLTGSLLMFVTMILHPGEGGFTPHSPLFAIISHSLAIFSVPFSAVGFWGLSRLLDSDAFWARVGLAFMTLGLFAAVMAATLNGLAMPLFAMDLSPEMKENAFMISNYNRALNHSLDYILIAGMFISTGLWSIAILRGQQLPKWIGLLGLGLFVVGLVAILSGFYFLDLRGFRIFIWGWVVWIVGTGISILRKNESS